MQVEEHIKLDIFLSSLMIGNASVIVSPTLAVFIREMLGYKVPKQKQHNLVGYMTYSTSDQKTAIYIDPYTELHEKFIIVGKKVIDLTILEDYKNIEIF